jgi:hypothetical protein
MESHKGGIMCTTHSKWIPCNAFLDELLIYLQQQTCHALNINEKPTCIKFPVWLHVYI